MSGDLHVSEKELIEMLNARIFRVAGLVANGTFVIQNKPMNSYVLCFMPILVSLGSRCVVYLNAAVFNVPFLTFSYRVFCFRETIED